MLAKFRDLAIVATAAKRALQAMGAQVKAGFADAVRQEQAQASLAIALKTKVTPQWKTALDKINKYADGVQKTTTVSADLVRELARVGAEFGLTTEQIIVGTDAVLDRALQAQRAPLDMMRIFAKSIVGISEGWAELGVKIDKTDTKLEKFNAAIAQMATGAQRVIGSLPTSAIAKLGNELSDLRGLMVRMVVQTGAFQLAVQTVTGWVSKLKDIMADPKAQRAFAEFIDKTITLVINLSKQFASLVLLMVGKLLQAIEFAIKSLIALGNLFGANKRQIEEYEAQVEGFGNALSKAAKQQVDEMGEAQTQAQKDYLAAKKTLALLHGEFTLGSEKLLRWSESLLESSRTTNLFKDSMKILGDVLDKVIEKFGGVKEASAEVLGDEDAEARLAEQLVIFEEAGRQFGAVISYGIQDAFDRDIGAREAMDRLGKDMRGILIANFSDAALAPINQQFGKLAVTLAKPFDFVGKKIAKMLEPLMDLLIDALEWLGAKFLVLIGISEAAGIAGAKGVGVVALLAGKLAGVWGGAATAAAIATLGFATTFAVPAQIAIGVGAALAKATAIPAAEGALVLPSPGGTFMQVAEGGEAELIAPVSKLPGLLGGGGGGDMYLTVEIGSFAAGGEGSVESFFEEVGLRILEGRQLGNSGPGGLNL